MRGSAVDSELFVYLGGVVGLSGAVIALLGGLYVSRVPEFPRSFVADPVGAVRGDPVAVAFVFGIVLATVLLVALIVGFGARYGMAGDE